MSTYVPGFVAKTQSPSLPDSHFDEFSFAFLYDFVDGDRDEMLLCPLRAMKKHLSQTQVYRPAYPHMFISNGKHKKCVSRNTAFL